MCTGSEGAHHQPVVVTLGFSRGSIVCERSDFVSAQQVEHESVEAATHYEEFLAHRALCEMDQYFAALVFQPHSFSTIALDWEQQDTFKQDAWT